MRSVFSVLFLIVFVPATSLAQLFEDFEEGSKNAYAAGVVEFSTGEWLLDDALVGRSEGDRFKGEKSVRIRNDGFIEMLFDYPEGASLISFWGANSGFSGDTGGVVQVFYSVDQGNNWQPAGEGISLTEENQLEQHEIELTVDSPVRFRFEKQAGNRINIDDVRIDPFVELSDQPVLSIRKGEDLIQPGDQLNFQPTNIGDPTELSVTLINHGEPNLEIHSAGFDAGSHFFITDDLPPQLSARESAELNIQFISESGGRYDDRLTIHTNDPEIPEFDLTISALAVDEQQIINISDAREVPFGTRVTISGRVTVANEFNGPLFLQDETAGFAVFHEPLHSTVQRGDSIIVTGPVTEFNPFDGTPGTFLRQIAATEQDDDISFEIVDTDPVHPKPIVITLSEMNSGEFESRLITIEGVTFLADGVLQGNQNYGISDRTGSGQLRIDNSAAELIGASIPAEPIRVTGVVDRFAGTYQIKPRDNEDLKVEPHEIVGEDIPQDHTFDVVTWNIEWFGVQDRGPSDTYLQMKNVISVIETIDADLYAVQEIAGSEAFYQLVSRLDEYSGFLSSYPQRQQTGYLFKTTVIDSLRSGHLTTNQDRYDWASGRFPLYFEFDATVQDETRRIRSYNIHAKAFGDQESYNRRKNAAISLKEYFDDYRSDEKIIFLGDFNDQLNFSTFNEVESPYQVFLDDERYDAVTKPLEDRGFASYLVGQYRSLIDHIIINDQLFEKHIDGAQRVENPHYIASYLSTTSDHAPVWTRFQFSEHSDNDDDDGEIEIPESFVVKPNYPNPFNPSTMLRFSLAQEDRVTITVYDILGRPVSQLLENELFTAGHHEVIFDATGLSTGMYLYNIQLESGESQTEKMMFIQ